MPKFGPRVSPEIHRRNHVCICWTTAMIGGGGQATKVRNASMLGSQFHHFPWFGFQSSNAPDWMTRLAVPEERRRAGGELQNARWR